MSTAAKGAAAAAVATGKKKDFDVSRLHWSTEGAKQANFQSHPVFESADIEEIHIEHKVPRDVRLGSADRLYVVPGSPPEAILPSTRHLCSQMTEKIALAAVTTARSAFDLVTG